MRGDNNRNQQVSSKRNQQVSSKRNTRDEFGRVFKPTSMVLEVLGNALITLIVGGLCLFVLGGVVSAIWSLIA